jgi:putative membrane protein
VIDLSQPRRQSPWAVVLLGMKAIGRLGIVQVTFLVLILVRGALDGRLLLVASLAVLALAAFSVMAWWRYTFRLVGGELIVDRGVIRTDRLTISVERIQSIAVEQELLHRLTGLVKVTVETAGSSDAEFTIDAVSRPVAEELRRSAVPAAPPHVGDDSAHVRAPSERVVFRHTPRRLLVAALTMSPWAGLALLLPLLAVGDRFVGTLIDEAVIDESAVPELDAASLVWWTAAIAVAAVALVVILLNVIRVLLTDWDLTLRTDGTSLRATSGLVSTRSHTSNVDRVQVVEGRQSPLRRRVGLRDLRLSNAGAGDVRLIGCDDDEVASTSALAGVTPVDAVVLDRRVHPAQVWLHTRNTAVGSVAVAAVLWFLVGWWAIAALVAVPAVWWASRRAVRLRRWALGGELVVSRRLVSTATEQALLRKANVVRVTQTLFERRRGLGRIELVTAAGAIEVGMLPVEEARAARDLIVHAVETDRRAWM